MSPSPSSAGPRARAHDRVAHVALPSRPVRPLWDGDSRGSEVAALSSALLLTVAAGSVTLTGHLGLVFDLAFVAICIVAACLVRRRDFFTVGVLPPLLMFGTMLIVALNGPKVIAAPGDGVVQAVVTGLARHSLPLLVGYAATLLILLGRRRFRLT